MTAKVISKEFRAIKSIARNLQLRNIYVNLLIQKATFLVRIFHFLLLIFMCRSLIVRFIRKDFLSHGCNINKCTILILYKKIYQQKKGVSMFNTFQFTYRTIVRKSL